MAGFLLGLIVAFSFTAALFFLKFWRRTREFLFLAFAIAFFVEGCNRLMFLRVSSPSDASPSIYIVRLLAFLLILTAIIKKNTGASRQ